MGMFDYIKVETPLPRHGFQDIEFQTKDLECCLHHYTIKEDGRLFVEKFRIDDEDLAPPKHAKDVTATVSFYAHLSDDIALTWIEFKAIIVRGKLLEPIKLVQLEKERRKKP